MSRLNYADSDDFPGQTELWHANARRSIRGTVGQRELRVLEAALLALPEPVLIHERLVDAVGDVCAIGCYAQAKGVDLSTFDPNYETEDVGAAAGMPRMVAWSVIDANDLHPRLTPQERYTAVLAWVRAQLTAL